MPGKWSEMQKLVMPWIPTVPVCTTAAQVPQLACVTHGSDVPVSCSNPASETGVLSSPQATKTNIAVTIPTRAIVFMMGTYASVVVCENQLIAIRSKSIYLTILKR